MLSELKHRILNRHGALDRPAVDFTGEEANRLLTEKLLVDEPLMVARFGAFELSTLIAAKTPVNPSNIRRLISGEIASIGWRQSLADSLCHNAGFFPNTRLHINRYADLLLSDIAYCDILGSWLPGEKRLPSLTPNIHYKTIRRVDLEPFPYLHPYTLSFTGKKVLIVHPYEQSIKHQWPKRDTLFGGRHLWPECSLTIMKSVQSIAGNKTPFATWFDALDDMKRQMDTIDYDIALIGCGAYGFHLAAHAKRTGHKAIHIGGVLQMLFGIIGSRWDGKFDFVDDNWIRPLPIDRPAGASTIENGCYW